MQSEGVNFSLGTFNLLHPLSGITFRMEDKKLTLKSTFLKHVLAPRNIIADAVSAEEPKHPHVIKILYPENSISQAVKSLN